MILSNFTFSVSLEHAIAFELWIKNDLEKNPEEYLSINEVKHFKLLTEINEDAVNYSVQFYFKEIEHQKAYVNTNFKELIERLDKVLQGKYVYFPTTLKQF